MTGKFHELIHLIAELEKEDMAQLQAHSRKKEIYDKIGEILNELVKDEP